MTRTLKTTWQNSTKNCFSIASFDSNGSNSVYFLFGILLNVFAYDWRRQFDFSILLQLIPLHFWTSVLRIDFSVFPFSRFSFQSVNKQLTRSIEMKRLHAAVCSTNDCGEFKCQFRLCKTLWFAMPNNVHVQCPRSS